MIKNMKILPVWSRNALFLFIFLILTTNCEEMINQALSKDITFEEEIINPENANTSNQKVVYPITTNSSLYKNLAKGSAINCNEYYINPDNIELFIRILSGGHGLFNASFSNNLSPDQTLSIYLSTKGSLDDSDLASQATLYGSFTVPGNGSKILDGLEDFNESSSEILSRLVFFFLNNLDMQTLYIYLAASETPVDISIDYINLVLYHGYLISKTIYPSDEYTQYQDNINEIKDIMINGTVKNNGSAKVTMKFYAYVQGQSPQLITLSEINPGEELIIENIDDFFTSQEINTLKNIFNHLFDPGEAIVLEVLFLSSDVINLAIGGISLTSTVTVSL
ncbi:MAG: hypothetical protein P8078_08315 [bacterium]